MKYESQYIEAMMKDDTERMNAIKRINGILPTGIMHSPSKDELIALFGEAYGLYDYSSGRKRK